MPLGEELVSRIERTAGGYAAKVRWLAVIYVALPLVCLALLGVIAWRARHLITLAQRSNVETLVVAIVGILALYYLVTTASGLYGGLRIAWFHLPLLWRRSRRRVEQRKHDALADGGAPLHVSFDHVVHRSDDPSAPLSWAVGDDAGVLGTLELRGSTAWFHPRKAGVSNSLFDYLADRLNARCDRGHAADRLVVVFWGNIDPEPAAVFRAAVAALDGLANRLGGPPVWPSLAIDAARVAAIGDDLRAVVPALRSEAMLPDLEFGIEYSVPILPEPLAFVQLKRHERRADPVLTLSYALVIMCLVLLAVLLLIAFPPWVPSR